MRLPSMKYADGIAKVQQIKFGGLNHTYAASDGELWDMKNLSSDHAPVLATRQLRKVYRKLEKPGGLFCWEKLCWVDGTGFFVEGEEKGKVSEGMKTFASLGRYIIIMPDKCWYHVDTEEFGSLEAKWEGASLTFTNGIYYDVAAQANTIQAEGVNWADIFNVGDGVQISGCTKTTKNNTHAVIHAIDGDKLYFDEFIFTLDGDDGDQEYTETGDMSISRSMPDLEFICENENRLWGVESGNIHACAWGNIFNWDTGGTNSESSWAVPVGSPGEFTGGITYKGFAIFFKESNIHKVYGTIPSNFQVMSSATLGIAKGSSRSLAIAGETLFYLSQSGIVAYGGGIPQPIGEALGAEQFRNAVGGSDGLKYYVSMQGDNDRWRLYVYDTQRSMWHIEDDTHVTHFANKNGVLYLLDEKGVVWMTGKNMSDVDAEGAEVAMPFYAEFGDFTEEDPDKKGVSKLQLRLELDAGTTAQVYIQFDSDGSWNPVGDELKADVKRSYYIPIIPRRCDHYRIRISGQTMEQGGCRIYSMARESYSGSELKSTRRN